MILNRLTISNDNNKEVIKSKKNYNVVHYADPTDVLMEIVVNHTFRSKISHFLAPHGSYLSAIEATYSTVKLGDMFAASYVRGELKFH